MRDDNVWDLINLAVHIQRMNFLSSPEYELFLMLRSFFLANLGIGDWRDYGVFYDGC
jgi:hypothetical protein